MCSRPQVKSPSITIYSPLPSSTSLHTSLPLVITKLLSDTCQSGLCIYESVFILLVSLFCSLDSHVSEIIWYLFFSDWHILFVTLWTDLENIMRSFTNFIIKGDTTKYSFSFILLGNSTKQ